MASRAFILIAGDRAWQVAEANDAAALSNVAVSADADPREVAAEIATALERIGYRGEPTLLALPSTWCLTAPMSIRDLPPNDRKAMLFRFEEQLPVAVETVAADFIVHRERALGVCVKLDALAPLIEALEAKNVAIQIITPAAMLSAQARAGTDLKPQLLLFREEQQLNTMALESGTLVGWSLTQPLAADVTLQVDILSMELAGLGMSTPLIIRAWGVDEDVLDAVARKTGRDSISVLRDDLAATTCRAAGAVLSGKLQPWIDLRRGPLAIRDPIRLHRGPLNRLLAAAAVFLLVLGSMLWVRSQRFAHVADRNQALMTEEFHRQYPAWSTPSNVRAVLESETRKILVQVPLASVGTAGESALKTLHGVLDRLPDTMRLKIDRMTFTDRSFEMEGRLRSYEGIDGLSAAARQVGMEIPPPQVHRDTDGFWTFVLRGTKPASRRPAVAGDSDGAKTRAAPDAGARTE